MLLLALIPPTLGTNLLSTGKLDANLLKLVKEKEKALNKGGSIIRIVVV